MPRLLHCRFARGSIAMGERPGVDTETDTRPSARSASLSLSPAEQRLRALARDGALPGLDVETSLALDEHSSSPVTSRIGRYTVLRKLGEGGMGVVYACYDEELDRKVAVKLLRSRYQGESAKLRMQREAQGLARLSHPNVVQIYEIGEHHGALFLAMEFVEGKTLRAWVREREASLRAGTQWREILRVLLQAGRGLAAAHAAELIHRDFKPDNVMIGRDGRARVLDFGLVRGVRGDSELTPEPLTTGDPTRGDDEDGGSGSSSRKLLQHTMTHEGSVLGTPRYMAPEQLRGLPCDALADQFAFCVVAFEALFGVRPFAGDSLVALHVSMMDGALQPIPAESTVPRAVRDAVVRGLAIEPSVRWPRIDALLDALERALDERRRWSWGLAVGGIAIAAAVGASAMLAGDAAPPKCAIDESMLAGTWSAEQRERVREAFRATGGSHADVAATTVEAELDRWSERWIASQRDACEATHIRNVQSMDMLDKRTGCLERQRERIAAIVQVLGEADSLVLGSLPELLASLPDVAACEDARTLEGEIPLPADADRARAAVAAYRRLARVHSLLGVERAAEAERLLAEISEDIVALDHSPLTLEVRALRARVLLAHEDFEAGVPLLLDAAREASALRLDDLAATMLAGSIATIVGNSSNTERERVLLADADVAIRRIGRQSDARHIEVLLGRGRLAGDDGKLDQAKQELDRAHALASAAGSLLSSTRIQTQLGIVLAELGRLDDARASFLAAREAQARLWGHDSVPVAHLDFDLGLLELAAGNPSESERHLLRAHQLYSSILGDASLHVARVNLARAKLAMTAGELDGARDAVEAALPSFESAKNLRLLAEALTARGVLRFFAHDYHGSLEAYRQARHHLRRVVGPDHLEVALLDSNIGESLAALGDHPGALTAYAAAIDVLRRSVPEDHPAHALPLKGRGQSYLALGRFDAAIEDLERALTIHERSNAEPLERADVRRSLARALRAAGRDPERTAEVARRAAAELEELGLPERAREIDAWLQNEGLKGR